MNRIEGIIHGLIGEYPTLRIPLVAAYQRICSIIPSNNYERVNLTACVPGFFFGFHDKCPWSHDNSKLLSHQFDVNSSISQLEGGPVNVGFFEHGRFEEYRVVGSTNAWNWQQGASLQWVGDTGKIIYNDIDCGNNVAKIFDIKSNLCESILGHVMAVSNDGKYALSCSFERFGQGMPGYGYRNGQFVDEQNELLPGKEGLTIVDLHNYGTKLIVELKNIAHFAHEESMTGAYHFFSHCLFSPNCQRILFFHRYLCSNGTLKTRMFSSDLRGQNIWHFPGKKFSHISWASNTTILAYCKPQERSIGFYFLEEFSSEADRVAKGLLCSDGHPQVSSDGNYFLVDTYPDRYRNQRLLLYDIEKKECKLLVKYRIPFKYRYERRCDFHPRWNRDDSLVCFDSAHNNVRSLCIMSSVLKKG